MNDLTVRPQPKMGKIVFDLEQDESGETLADVRREALHDLAIIITELHGARPAIHSATDPTAVVWGVFDLLSDLTRSDELHSIDVSYTTGE